MNEVLHKMLLTAPKRPGCYLFKDNLNNVIYVGKSKMLANRVRSYFTTAAKKDERISDLVRQIVDVEFLVTPSETEALLQECRLIKLYKPWYNSQLKRDTLHPFIRIDSASEYPSISIVDEVIDDGAEYFGSFFDIYDAGEAVETLNSIWKTPLCKQAPLPRKACLFHSIDRCKAPCVAAIKPESYAEDIAEVTMLLRGEHVPAVDRFEEQIGQQIRDLAFEKAAATQKNLTALEKLRRKGQKLFRLQEDQDAIILVRAYHAPECMMFYVRRGIVVNRAFLCSEMSVADKEHAVEQGLHVDDAIIAESWLTQCVSEVFAEKRFALIAPQMSDQDTRTIALKMADELISSDM